MPIITQDDLQNYFKGNRCIIENKMNESTQEEAYSNLNEIEIFIQSHSQVKRIKQYGTCGAERGLEIGVNIGKALATFLFFNQMVDLSQCVEIHYSRTDKEFGPHLAISTLVVMATSFCCIPVLGGISAVTGGVAGSIYGFFSQNAINKDELTYLHTKAKHKLAQLKSDYYGDIEGSINPILKAYIRSNT